MAGSFSHVDDDGDFRFDLIENLGDAYEACEQMHWMIHHLAAEAEIKEAVEAYYEYKRGGKDAG